jgi:hypothetical protein
VLALRRAILHSVYTSLLRRRGHNEDRWADVAPAVRVVLALLESAGASRLAGTPGSSMQAGLHFSYEW